MCPSESSAATISYEADQRGRIYEKNGTSVWPTGVTYPPFAARSDISADEFERVLRAMDERDRRLA